MFVLDISKLPSNVLSDVAEQMGWEPTSDNPKKADLHLFLEEMKQMSGYEFFDKYLNYYGIIGFTGQIWLTVQLILQGIESAKEINRDAKSPR